MRGTINKKEGIYSIKVTHSTNFDSQFLLKMNSVSQNSDCVRIHRQYKIPCFITQFTDSTRFLVLLPNSQTLPKNVFNEN